MKAALDVHYREDDAAAACAIFTCWEDSSPVELVRSVVPGARMYRPGAFYERELPCLLSVLQAANRRFETIVIDGYVHLQAGVGKGLGLRLSEALPYAATVVGVAKNPLKVADRFVPITRGRSKKPLFVSAVGCSLAFAREAVLRMHGPYRVPTMLRIVDQHARGALRKSSGAPESI